MRAREEAIAGSQVVDGETIEDGKETSQEARLGMDRQ